MSNKHAKYFVYIPVNGNCIYISKELNKLQELSKNSEYYCSNCGTKSIYALIDTEKGETLMHLDYRTQTPKIAEKYLPWKYIEKIYTNREVINI